MKLIDREGAVFVKADEGMEILGGPFVNSAAARVWMIERIEGTLKPEKLALWQRVSAANPISSDMGREVYLITMVAKGRKWEDIVRYIPGRAA